MLAPMVKPPPCPAAALQPANENAAPRRAPPGFVPVVGYIGEGDVVTFTDPTWAPRPAIESADVLPFPSDPREA